jgi:hydroxypyruvate isomerase
VTLRFAASLDHLFTDLPLPDRIAAAKAAGYEGVEIAFPYDRSATETRTALIMSGIDLALMSAPPPNWTGGPRGFAAVPGLAERFRRDLDRALRFAGVLKPRHLRLLAGAAEGPAARAVLVENLRWATAQAPKMSFLIEPLPPETVEGWFLTGYAQAAELIDEVGAPNLGLIFDLGHAGQITGDAMACWTDYARHVRHVRISGPPGDPDAPALLDRLARDGYRGFVGGGHLPAPTAPTG